MNPRRPGPLALAVALALALAIVVPAAVPGPAEAARPHPRGESPSVTAPRALLVRLAPGTTPAKAAALWTAAGVQPLGPPSRLGVQVVLAASSKARASALVALQGDPRVGYAERDGLFRAAETPPVPNDPQYPQEWWLSSVDVAPAWEYVGLRDPVTVAVLDTGAALDHPDLTPVLVPGYNVLNPDLPPADDSTMGHGTHVAGIVGAATDNGIGMAGVGWGSPIMPVKVLGGDGVGDDATVAEGLTWAADHGARVINMSLYDKDPTCTRTLTDAVNYAWSKGVVLVAASGNEGGVVGCPASLPHVIAVGSVNQADVRHPTSDYGPALRLVAPGVGIVSTVPLGVNATGYRSLTGTSMATPMVSGAAALVRSAAPSLSASQVADVLSQTARDLGPAGRDDEYGYGEVDVGAAVLASAELTTRAAVVPALMVRAAADGGGGGAAAAALSFTALVPLTATVRVERDDGTPVQSLFSGPVAVGPVSYPWDGMDDAGTAMPDGWYRFRADLVGPAGRNVTATTPVGVTSALIGASVKPTTFSPNGDGRYETTTVTYTLQAPAAVEVRVLAASGSPVRTLFSGPLLAGSGTATWDGRVGSRIAAPGAYTIAVAATTAAGTFELRSPVVLDLRGVTATNLRASTVYNYPDGYRDTTSLRFRLSGRATVTVFVYRAGSSTPIRTLRAGVLPAGNAAVAWDGRDSAGRRLAAGSYRFRVQARDPAAIVRLSGYGTVAVSGKRLVRRTVTVTVTGDAYLPKSYRSDEAHAFIEPSPAYPNGVRARVESGTGAGGPAVTLYYQVTLPTAVTAESLTATVDFVRTGTAPRVRVHLPGVTRSPEMLLEPLGGPLTVVLPAAILIDLVPGPAPPSAIVEVTLDGTGTLDLASFRVRYAYGVPR